MRALSRDRAPALLLALLLAALGGCTVPSYAFDGAVRRDAGPCVTCGTRCVDIATDPEHCGACGMACPTLPNTDRRCAFGRCLLPCRAGFEECDGDLANGCEAELATSVQNCGRCRNRCAEGPGLSSRCASGRCEESCAAGRGNCDGDLSNGCETDLSSAQLHCGTCGNACRDTPGATARCAMGACRSTCRGEFADCVPSVPGCETNTTTSANHCGACNRACPAGRLCANGACTSECPPGQVACGTSCANLATDAANCGACGTSCAAANASGVCEAGLCVRTCSSGFGDCDAAPANGCEQDLQTDPAHCGTCTTACPAGPEGRATCTGGRCGLSCTPGNADCDGMAATGCEADTRTSLVHCGACGAACAARAGSSVVCAAGRCEYRCDDGRADCDGVAGNGCETDTSTSSQHCGACGATCPAAQVCAGGACAAACSAGQTPCPSGCTNLATDPTHCGACDTRCPAGPSATATCAASRCGIACTTGYLNCNGAPDDGCEVNGQTSAAHCGACPIACPAGAHATPQCVLGACRATCDPGYTDCNGVATDGCEADLSADALNCGSCGARCILPGAVAGCDRGACTVRSCTSGRMDCNRDPADGCEVGPAGNYANCGGCGRVCPAGDYCINNMCCATGLYPCGGTCRDIASDPNNCGNCGIVCGPGRPCFDGDCI